jgi:hypothetical protein
VTFTFYDGLGDGNDAKLTHNGETVKEGKPLRNAGPDPLGDDWKKAEEDWNGDWK